ncbi:FAD-dependent oxidoreductase [Undibacterium pigrum]|uniref:2-polyprenyl-6-methoxyphenol hydroxylase-like FAD-dependent oxidoreductase n=1 Tax=Undibacterium pigrum TaxID=401470 RepID=A0A318J3C4_9BURK|nr:FAD-dependent monooxygenase [Undibacterium pigrum]PXX41643.1 2-polyprenyl-6-methoxyphenol hydroxylase-like FAD-dependent oxidoreductase [Undibacterium pigrum]
MNTPLQICIIGAGLGGLCLAQGLKKNGISFEVHEKDQAPDSRSQGYRLRIDQHGQTALTACLPAALYDLFQRSCALPSEQVNTLNPQLETLTDKWVKDWQHDKAGAETMPDLKANRLSMREVLLSGIQGHVHFNKKLIDYAEQADGKILARFADGSSSLADILVAADGVHSRVRELCFPELAPQDTGSICIYGKTAYSDEVREQVAAQLQTGTTIIFAHEMAAVIDTMLFRDDIKVFDAISHANDYIYWALIGKRTSFGLQDDQALPATTQTIRACLNQTSTSWASGLQALFHLTPAEALALLPVKTATTMPVWQTQHITALGDASHAMSPASGLGANSALYDAAALTLAITQIHTGASTAENVIRNYESLVRQHSFAALQASQKGSKQLFGDEDK